MPLTHSYATLPERFYKSVAPTPVHSPTLVRYNAALAEEIGFELGEENATSLFSGNIVREDMHPIAQAYAGHQFGHFVPQLGDGRAVLLGESVNAQGKYYDIQLKGAGRTPFSRMGDGRAPIGPAIREYILCEAMHALGIPTTRALALVTTGEPVMREETLPGAVITRVAASYIRVGTFEYFAAREDSEALQHLLDYVIERHYLELRAAEEKPLALLRAVCNAQAKLVAQWSSLGFIHGVMNTDNTTLSGETIDYGPCAFMEAYDPNTVFSYIDEHGRYAYGNQGPIMQWNMACLAECLLPLMPEKRDEARAKTDGIIREFQSCFMQHWRAYMCKKIGIANPTEGDLEHVQKLLSLMQHTQLDFTLTFRNLIEVLECKETSEKMHAAPWQEWMGTWKERIGDTSNALTIMRAANPLYIPRNHLVQRAIRAAEEHNDFVEMETLLGVLAHPYSAQQGRESYALPAPNDERVYQTFCGT